MWEYAASRRIAEQYDDFFAFNRLFEFDQQVLARYFSPSGLVLDLGCGTGRALVPLVRRGYRGLAVDLSEKMLQIVHRKAELENLPIQCVRANLVQLECLADDLADYAICLFSTLGMVRGHANRRRVLEHARRILKPGGLFVLHAHNRRFGLFDSGQLWWLAKNLLRARLVRDVEPGDKFLFYRGIPNLFLHIYTRRELTGALRQAGFRVREVIPLNRLRNRALARPWLLGQIRANGWIVVCD
jgi:SAM-dependent methyltransferase